ncbi:uncharacterized protein FFUJ_08008 [Fusarium fujikuroi IMI 58289]|uniref:Uncharacterized protein n=1 Tax=Gibberella fujikuroi (strain CBS 195.34 / IMI 58289 / NRRL A-6831) TaxID=1279085 RepID=S0E2Q2_GIBF5|nr:uncharacterized protein FFUJ_08008 [Fusarium fujikuroi IMI 58289]KLP14104.1 uncharacterized protein LW94_11261 [Fusarium fujikuroi]CCT69071.1 uncharacterized protein FFUJ_08008 [Fusarium fujikuroi IMI 58289]SCO07895.1 uncharacterized protein FFM5_09210 [Fusarium fujikuroi]SCO44336.1 uncharacterized protein FFMR_07451 [Fusarium fujikuroi]
MSLPTFQGTPMPDFSVHMKRSVSIRYALSQPNPALLGAEHAPSSTRGDTTRHAVKALSILKWTDFNIEVLEDLYKDMLSQMVLSPSGAKSGPFHLDNIEEAKKMFLEHLGPRLEDPIEQGAALLGSQFGHQFPAVVVKPGRSFDRQTPTLSYVAGNEPDARTLVVNICLHANAWHSSMIGGNKATIARRPLDRLAKYCLLARTRYGFLMSTKEIVVMRIRGKVFDTSMSCHVEWQAIPWSVNGPYELTACLSIWFLVMLSLDDLRLSGSPPHYLPPPYYLPAPRSLNVWARYQIPKGFFYRHPSSGQREAELPEGAEFEDSPHGTSS